MMHPMSKRTKVTVGLVTAGAWWLLVLAGCGGKDKPAESAGTCPEGTVLSGDNCLPSTSGGKKGSDDDDSPKGNTKGSTPSSAHASGGDDMESGGNGSYDKDAVEAQLKRAAKQIKNNCGSASDDDGNRNGPWGSTSATIVLGRNGHIHEVTVPSPYAGTPVGDCVVNSFKKLVYPPYAGSTDATISWDVEITKPKQK